MSGNMIKKAVLAAAAVLMMSAMTGCSLTSIQPNAKPVAVQDSVASSTEKEESTSETASSEAAVQEEETSVAEAVTETVVSSAESAPAVITESVAETVESTLEEAVMPEAPIVAPMEIAEVPKAAPLPDAELKVMGEEKEGDNVFKLRIENAAEQNMIGLAVRARSDGYDTATYEFEEDPFVPSERRMLIYDGDKAVKEAKSGGDIVEFQITVTYDDGFVYKLGKIPFGDAGEIKVIRGDGYAYIVYALTEEKVMVSTENEERARQGLDEIELEEIPYSEPAYIIANANEAPAVESAAESIAEAVESETEPAAEA